MDYAFVHGTSGYYNLAIRMLRRRSNTTYIANNRTRNNLKKFIEHLDTTGSITNPIDNIILTSHANSSGYLEAQMYPGQSGGTNYETLLEALSNAGNSIAIPDTLIGFSAAPPTHYFHIKGCNIGKATPFLNKFKEALGNHILVTAPIHFHGLSYLSTHGTWELMAYEFKVKKNSRFNNRNDLIAAFVAGGFTFYNGDPVAQTDFESWTPNSIINTQNQNSRWNLGLSIQRRTTVSFNREFRVRKVEYNFTITYPSASSVPTSIADRLAALTQGLTDYKFRTTDTENAFDSAHPYPQHERLGFTDLNDFINGHTWEYTKSGSRLICKGHYFEYTHSVPITTRSSTPALNNLLIFNFYPKPGLAIAPIPPGLVETDPNFFAQV